MGSQGTQARGLATAAAPSIPSPQPRLAHAPVPGFPSAFPSEAISLAATAAAPGGAPPPLRVLVLPGNPGAAAFYTPFLARLHERLGGRADVVALSLHGHDAGLGLEAGAGWAHPPRKRGAGVRNLAPVTGLDGQVAHAVAAAAALAATGSVCGSGGGGPAPVALVGHSIGALIALRAAAALDAGGERGSTAAVVALMPYLAFNAAAPQQRALKLLTRRPGRAAAAAAAAGLAAQPGRVQGAILRAATGPADRGLAPHAAGAVLAFLGAGGTRHALGLAATEFKQLSAPAFTPEWGLLARLGSRGAAFYADGDHWCPVECGVAGLGAAAAAAPDAKIRLLDNQRHDFPVCEARSASAADAVAAVLLEMVVLEKQ